MMTGFVFGVQVILLIASIALTQMWQYGPFFIILGFALLVFDGSWMLGILPMSLSWWAGFGLAVLGAILAIVLIIGGWRLFSNLRTQANRKETAKWL